MAMKDYSDEFKADAVALYESTPGATYKDIVADLGIADSRCTRVMQSSVGGHGMSAEIAQVVEQAGPYVTAALGAYGSAVLTRAESAAADATANVGRRILRAVWRRRDVQGRTELEVAVREAADEPANEDAVGALRQQIRRALREDTALLRDVTAAMPASSSGDVTASGERAVAAGGSIGIAITGDNNRTER